MTVIDFRTARDAKRNNAPAGAVEEPDPEYTSYDRHGTPMYTFSLSYKMGYTRFSVHIFAYSKEDAMARIEAMKEGLQYDGQVYGDG